MGGGRNLIPEEFRGNIDIPKAVKADNFKKSLRSRI
jgi:hypothetical protein